MKYWEIIADKLSDESGNVIQTHEHKCQFESRSAILVRDSGYGAAFIGDSSAIFASVSNRMKVMGAAPELGEILALEKASV